MCHLIRSLNLTMVSGGTGLSEVDDAGRLMLEKTVLGIVYIVQIGVYIMKDQDTPKSLLWN